MLDALHNCSCVCYAGLNMRGCRPSGTQQPLPHPTSRHPPRLFLNSGRNRRSTSASTGTGAINLSLMSYDGLAPPRKRPASSRCCTPRRAMPGVSFLGASRRKPPGHRPMMPDRNAERTSRFEFTSLARRRPAWSPALSRGRDRRYTPAGSVWLWRGSEVLYVGKMSPS